MSARRRILVCANSTVREEYITGEAVARLEQLGDWEWVASEGVSTRTDVCRSESLKNRSSACVIQSPFIHSKRR